MTSAYTIQTAVGDWEDSTKPTSDYVSTSTEIDRDLDPFDRPTRSTSLCTNAWFTREALEDEIGILVTQTHRAMDVPLRGFPGRTRVSRHALNTVRVLFDVSKDLAFPCEWRVVAVHDVVADPFDPPAAARTDPPAAHLDSSLNEIQDWLGISLQHAADAAGISRGTIYAWRDRASVPRPATVHAILRLHGLVAAAVRTVGTNSARRWFHAGQPSPLQLLLDGHGDDEATRQVSKRLRRELIAPDLPLANPWLAANSVDLAE